MLVPSDPFCEIGSDAGSKLRGAEELLAETRGRFLEGWDEVARVTEGRGSSVEMVEELGVSLSSTRVDLIREVGSALLDQGEGGRAAQYLEEGLELRPDRGDVRALLARAYAQSGQFERAQALQRDG